MSQINKILDNIKLPQIMKVSQIFDDSKLENVEKYLKWISEISENMDSTITETTFLSIFNVEKSIMEEMKPVVFKLDSENYGVDIGRVLGIEREQQIVRVPNTVSYIKGIMNLRGEIIPVYDLRKKFGLPAVQNQDIQFIIVRVKDSKIALEVDGVKEIHDVAQENKFPVPPICINENTRYFESVIKSDNTLIVLINVDYLLSDEEMKRIDELVNSESTQE